MMKVYLAGNISGTKLEECMAWRKKIREHYENCTIGGYPIIWLDPLNGGEIGTIDAEGLTSNLPPSAIVDKDYLSVKKSDIVIANMSTWGCKRPPIGSIAECAWAYELRKPLILITTNEWYTKHPFMLRFSSWIVDSVEELLEKKVIEQYFKAIHTAQY